jgi:hypothetical protein
MRAIADTIRFVTSPEKVGMKTGAHTELPVETEGASPVVTSAQASRHNKRGTWKA